MRKLAQKPLNFLIAVNPVVFLLMVTIPIACIAMAVVPFEEPLPIYLDFAQIYLHTGVITSNLVPHGYTIFLSNSYSLMGLWGIYLAQSVLYVLSSIISYYILKVWGANKLICLLGALLIALHPYQIVNIKRIVDSNAIVPAFLILIFLTSCIYRNRADIKYSLASGLALGLLILFRPSAWLIAGVTILGIILWKNIAVTTKLVNMATVVAASLLLVGAVNYHMTGAVRFLPDDGADNLFLGANQYTRDALLTDLNAESSAMQALTDAGVDLSKYPSTDAYSAVLAPYQRLDAGTYSRLAWAFISGHLDEYIGLIGIKAFTLFRPDFRQITLDKLNFRTDVTLVFQIVLALPLWIWLAIRLWLLFRRRYSGHLLLIVGILIVYLSPMLLSNSDPRYRLPIDILLLIDIAFCIGVIFAKVKEQPVPEQISRTAG